MNRKLNHKQIVVGVGLMGLLALSACAPLTATPANAQTGGYGQRGYGAGMGAGVSNGNAQVGAYRQMGRGPAANQSAMGAQMGGRGMGNGRGQQGQQGKPNTAVQQTNMMAMLNALPKGNLSTADAANLAYMREEEKLAHDVYVTLGAKWTLPIFNNIAQSEQMHTDAVKLLLDRYGLSDPTTGKAVGQFTNPTLQKLYNDLVTQGSQSLAEALRAGATIEDLDISDLNQRASTLPDVQMVFNNLTKGSRNHLRAFTRQLKTVANVEYQPQYLSQADYNAILSGTMERGPAQ